MILQYALNHTFTLVFRKNEDFFYPLFIHYSLHINYIFFSYMYNVVQNNLGDLHSKRSFFFNKQDKSWGSTCTNNKQDFLWGKLIYSQLHIHILSLCCVQWLPTCQSLSQVRRDLWWLGRDIQHFLSVLKII